MEQNAPKSPWRRFGIPALIILALGFFISLHFVQMGGELHAIDEAFDLHQVDCYIHFKHPMSCPEDLSQARLPYYIHAVAEGFFAPGTDSAHYVVSFIFGLATAILLTWFVKREFGNRTALIIFLLLTTSIPLLTASRTLLTMSNIIFAFFTVCTVISLFAFSKKPTQKNLLLTSLFYGLVLASNFLGIWLVLFIVPYYLISKIKFRPFHLLFFPVLLATFCLASPFYLVEFRWLDLIYYFLEFDFHPYWWNYFGTGSSLPPWWYALLLYWVKMTPWCAALFLLIPFFLRRLPITGRQKAFLFCLFSSALIYMLIKPINFGYDAPHHHIQFYLLSYIPISVLLNAFYARLKNRIHQIIGVILFGLLLINQIVWIIIFFPHLSFYGAQYGERYIGDIYGPAVIAQVGVDKLDSFFSQTLVEDEPILFPVGSIYYQPTGVIFGHHDPNYPYKYACDHIFVDHHLYAFDHENYQNYLDQYCEKNWNLVYPLGYEVYAWYECNQE